MVTRYASAIQIVRPLESIAETQPQLQPDFLRLSARSIVSFDRTVDDLGFLNNKFRQMLFYIVRSQVHRLISTGLVPKDADGRALALTSIEPIVAHNPPSSF